MTHLARLRSRTRGAPRPVCADFKLQLVWVLLLFGVGTQLGLGSSLVISTTSDETSESLFGQRSNSEAQVRPDPHPPDEDSIQYIYDGKVPVDIGEPFEVDLKPISETTLPSAFKNESRDAKLISMLMMIRLQNAACPAENGFNGTCYPRNQCLQLGGTLGGTCGAGFGVCCVFQKTCNTESNHNVTYFINPDWPTTYDGSIECPITIQKVETNICQFRLDFEEFTLAQPEPVDHICESDVFVVSGGRPVPPICGENTGQHMYIDAGPSSGNIKINIVTSGESYARKWRIKVSQIPCNAQYRSGESCLQYFSGMSGRLKSFNYGDPMLMGIDFGMQLSAQEYSICIRAEEGFCGIVYVPCRDSSDPGEAFVISSTSQNTTVPMRTMTGAEQCPSDWIGINCATDTGRETQTDSSSCVDRICGGTFSSLSGSTSHSPIYSYSRPFAVRVHFNDFEMSDPRAPDEMNRGFCLDFVQQPCPQSGSG